MTQGQQGAIRLTGFQLAAALVIVALWIAGDFYWISRVDPAALDCLASDTRSSRKVEAIVCAPRLLWEGVTGWIAFLWIWGPVAVIGWLLLRGRGRTNEASA